MLAREHGAPADAMVPKRWWARWMRTLVPRLQRAATQRAQQLPEQRKFRRWGPVRLPQRERRVPQLRQALARVEIEASQRQALPREGAALREPEARPEVSPQRQREAALRRLRDAKILLQPELWQSQGRQAAGMQLPAWHAAPSQWEALAGWAEQSCAARAAQAREPAVQRQQRAGWELPELWAERPGRSVRVRGCGGPQLLLPAFWQEWLSSRRRAWKRGTDRSWVQWSGKCERQRRCGRLTAFRARNARELSRPHVPRWNWSGSCLQPGQALPTRQGSDGS